MFVACLGIMPREVHGQPTAEKCPQPGDWILMSGGRVGKDGIHGVTASSESYSEHTPAGHVQIGDPYTQKKMHDFLLEARDRGYITFITDNGGGGLSSSIGESARLAGGASVELEKVPLKYAGLDVWEIWVSESQERMTVAVSPEQRAQLVNYLVRLGWAHGDQEIFSMEELIRYFDLGAVGKSAAIFNPEKLLWLNQQYIKGADNARLGQELAPFLAERGIEKTDSAFLEKVAADLRARSKTFIEMADASTFYFNDIIDYDPALAEKFFDNEGTLYLELLEKQLPGMQDYSKEGIEVFLRRLADENGVKLKNVVQPIRVALTGKTVSPGIDEVMITLGKERVLKRIKNALRFLETEGA
ncbi:MAG: Glutamate--tRNA ligase [Candidatus Omnitrophica bacterium ADurb.Bin277]|nr:MAG: Glutamate--tRNA ligase [Candidatus Omnitrophica bacterium ADurb.Bin277]